MGKDLQNYQNWQFSKPLSIVVYPDMENESVVHLQSGKNAQNER